MLSFLNKQLNPGKAVLNPLYKEELISPYDKKRFLTQGVYMAHRFLAKVCSLRADDKAAYQHIKSAKESSWALTAKCNEGLTLQNDYLRMAEKALPRDQWKAEIENTIASGEYDEHTVSVLKKAYGKEDGFESYLAEIKNRNSNVIKAKVKQYEVTPKPAFSFSLSDGTGKTVALNDLRGKIVVLDFWATWCGTCVNGFPAYQAVMKKYKDRSDITFNFIDANESRIKDKAKSREEFIDKIKAFLAERGYSSMPVLYDYNDEMWSAFAIYAVPQTIVIDKSGNIRYSIIGSIHDPDQLTQVMDVIYDTLK